MRHASNMPMGHMVGGDRRNMENRRAAAVQRMQQRADNSAEKDSQDNHLLAVPIASYPQGRTIVQPPKYDERQEQMKRKKAAEDADKLRIVELKRRRELIGEREAQVGGGGVYHRHALQSGGTQNTRTMQDLPGSNLRGQ